MIRMAQSTATVSRRPLLSRTRHFLWFTAAAALSTLPGNPLVVRAFTVRPVAPSPPAATGYHYNCQSKNHRLFSPTCTSSPTTRHFSSRNNNNNNNDDKGGGGLLDTITNAAKSILPSTWFQSEKEKQKAIERQRVRDEVNGGLQQMLKDAPLPIRMMGRMVGPLMSSAMSSMAESMAEQQQTVEEYMAQARMALQADEAVTRVLGEPLQVGAPFSQSSSTQSINGQTTTRVEIGFPVNGPRGSGMAQLSATQDGMQRLIVQAAGRQISVNLNAPRGGPRKFSSRNDNNDDVIEAEIIDKDTRS